MKVAVLSGKGGAGKTFVTVNLAAVASNAVYIDCDVEEPNGRLFLKPKNVETRLVAAKLPQFNQEKCIGCRKCVDFCHFNALAFIKNKPTLFEEVCHSCGGCQLVCPADAIAEKEHPVGVVEQGWHNGLSVVTGVLNLGEASGVPVIGEALTIGYSMGKNVFVDCPPGSACSVMECVNKSDFCVLVAEPTAFGFHNFKMVHELVLLMKKPCAVIINKMEHCYAPLEKYCEDNRLPIFARIPYSEETAKLAAEGCVAVEKSKGTKELFEQILNKIGGDDR